ncbi:MAG: RNA 2',3'-cyclic phosphodiesterase [Ignavibacteriota bacterium]|nr:RNA 2',3'-cyclic phosphodiesterase [Ignavibacteriota bacterium]
MRTFISLNLSEETVSVLKDFQRLVKDKLRYADSKNVKWEEPDKFHITLFFIGDIGEDKIGDLKISLGNINKEKTGKIFLELGILNGFPDLNSPRVLFAEVIDKENKLKRLSGIINNIMKDFGFEQSSKFHAHITLGRVKRNCTIEKIMGTGISHNFEINGVHLMKSALSRDGAVHESLLFVEL